jgi:hypothetical protein
MAKDRKLVADLLPCLREVAPICEGLEDTIMLANSDNYVGDLAFYQNVRQAAKRGVSGADTIYNDLKERFPGRPKKERRAPRQPLNRGESAIFHKKGRFLDEKGPSAMEKGRSDRLKGPSDRPFSSLEIL